MTSSKPYLIRAIYEWIEDNELTPYLYVNTEVEDVVLPPSLLSESPLILNISAFACMALQLHNDSVSFQARFSGEVFDVYLPIASVMAIVSRENGEGMSFPEETIGDDVYSDDELHGTRDKEAKKRPSLKIVK